MSFLFLIIFASLFLSSCGGSTPPDFSNIEATAVDTILFPLPENPLLLTTPGAEPVATSTATSIQDYIDYGRNQVFEGNIEFAISIFEQVLAIDPDNPLALHGRGFAKEAGGDHFGAIADFDLAIQSDPNFALAYNDRGELHFIEGNRAQALLDFSKAIELNPIFGRAYQNRALVQRDLGNPEAALIDLQVYLALNPDPDEVLIIQEMIEELALEMLPFEADREGRLYADDFSNPSKGGWYSAGDSLGLASYNSDGYRINVPLGNSAVWASNTLWTNDMRVEVDVRFIGGSQDNLFGILCRYSDSGTFYALVVSSDGYYGIGRRVNGGPLEPAGDGLGQLQQTNKIVTGENNVNHLTGICSGATLSLAVNGETLITLEDIGISAGTSGLIVATYDPAGSDLLFDNFEVYTP
jgi:tetratricopeptide (TPR) repeat protein